MRTEFPRQLMHLSGLLFLLFSVYVGKTLASAYFFALASFFLFYSIFVRTGKSIPGGILQKFEYALRRLIMRFERESDKPMMGAFWFYLALSLAFLIFPMEIAFLAGLVLSVGDALATLVGKPLGRHGILPGKSLEGSLAFLVGSFLACLAFSPFALALVASLGGLLGELLPGLPSLKNLVRRGLLNDNITIPLLSGLAMWFFMLLV
jgi:dolichol kinase